MYRRKKMYNIIITGIRAAVIPRRLRRVLT